MSEKNKHKGGFLLPGTRIVISLSAGPAPNFAPIEQLYQGDKPIVCWDKKDGRYVESIIMDVCDTAVTETRIVFLSNGSSFESAPDQKILTENGYLPARDLKAGMKIKGVGGVTIVSVKKNLDVIDVRTFVVEHYKNFVILADPASLVICRADSI